MILTMHKHQDQKDLYLTDLAILKSIQHILALTTNYTVCVTLLSQAIYRCCWYCRLSSAITTSLSLSKRTTPQHVIRLTTSKESFLFGKALTRVVLITLRESGVGLGVWNVSLRLRDWCPTILIIPVLRWWNTSWLREWDAKFLLILWAISTTRFLLRIFIVPNLDFLFSLSYSISLSPSNCWVISPPMFIHPCFISFMHSIFIKSETP